MLMPLVLAAAVAAGPAACTDPIVPTLKAAGFHGEDLRTAWAIVKRESGGRAKAISATGDYGLFQINRAAWSRQDWWDTSRMLTPLYNARQAFRISEGGKTFRAWGLDGQGRQHPEVSYGAGVYQKFRDWRAKFPAACADRGER